MTVLAASHMLLDSSVAVSDVEYALDLYHRLQWRLQAYSHGESSTSDRKKRRTDKDTLPDQQQRQKNMKCWNCKGQGHKASDRACPMFAAGKVGMERFRWDHEDPMKTYIENKKMREKEERLAHLKALVYLSSSSSSSDSSSESLDSGDSKKRRKPKSKNHKDHKKKKKRKDESVMKRKKSHESKSMKDKYHKRSKHRHKHHHHKHKKKS